ncbi:galactose mutarotase [Vagococcus sp. DIV0080]|uniref:Aldose 1-epimerase n=1 Tax=Candidatus Vagococcus giribetii TaxID=2230876 RepID=A0ABS3HPJ0_9ENTE|nr:aldose epimerase family protein [Vagococcus sp. DIV0080]MBO0475645.1 galactose mutarotase [Vagococcus sp. DIV0080]
MNHVITTHEETGITYITLSNDNLSATFLTFGARWHEFLSPNRSGKMENIILSLDTPESILADEAQFGALVGPVAGRIKQAQWKDVTLDKNFATDHHIHGGKNGWWCQFWDYSVVDTEDSLKVIFTLTDTTSGYPGPIHVKNTYELTNNAVVMTTEVTSEQETIVNPTNHVYFNLSGDAKHTIEEDVLFINSQEILETDLLNLPTGNKLAIEDTSYDFSQPEIIKTGLEQLESGIDDAYLLEKTNPQIVLSNLESGRELNISSNRQAVVVFSTTGFDASFFVNGKKMASHLGLAIETQELPDISHHPEWGSITLAPQTTKLFQTTYSIGLL